MREEAPTKRTQEDIDSELDLLMSGEISWTYECQSASMLMLLMTGGKLPGHGPTFTVTRCSTWLEISMPLPVDGQTGMRLMAISITPRFASTGQVEMSVNQQGRPEGTSLDSALLFDTQEAGKKLVDARYNVPIWLEWVTKHIQK